MNDGSRAGRLLTSFGDTERAFVLAWSAPDTRTTTGLAATDVAYPRSRTEEAAMKERMLGLGVMRSRHETYDGETYISWSLTPLGQQIANLIAAERCPPEEPSDG